MYRGVCFSPWGHKESETTEQLTLWLFTFHHRSDIYQIYSSFPHSRGGTSNHLSMPLRNWFQDSPRMSNYKMLKSYSQPSLFLNSTSSDSTNPGLCIVCHLWLVESLVVELLAQRDNCTFIGIFLVSNQFSGLILSSLFH